MLDFILRTFQRIGLYVGLLFIGSSLVVGGMKFYQHSIYARTPGTVLALMIKCDMSYRTGRHSTNHSVVECSEVNNVKARYPEVSWTVDHVQYVDVAYVSPDGRPMHAVVPLSRLEQKSANVGGQIPLLVSRDDPAFITGPANARFFGLLSVIFV